MIRLLPLLLALVFVSCSDPAPAPPPPPVTPKGLLSSPVPQEVGEGVALKQGSAARTLLALDYNPPSLDDAATWAMIEATGVTHIAIGINSPVVADTQGRWERMAWVDSRGDAVAQRVHQTGAVLVLLAWMVADEQYVRDAATDLAVLGERWSAGADMPNAELPWVGSATPERLVSKPWRGPEEVAARTAVVRRAHEADHAALAQLFYTTRSELGRGDADCWPAVVGHLPRAVWPLLEGGTGVYSQLQVVAGRTPGPPERQDAGWDRLERWRRPEEARWLLWTQHATYKQTADGVRQGEALAASLDTSLVHARSLEEANLGFWSLANLQRNTWAVPVLRAASPRVSAPHERWAP